MKPDNIKRIPKQPTRPMAFVATDDLVNELLISLKDVVACQSTLANNHAVSHANKTNEIELQKLRLIINKVVNLHSRINERGTGLYEALKEAGNKTDLDLRQLLNDCLRFPEIFPYVRNSRGLKKFFLCSCGEHESIDQQGLRLCAACLESMLECVKEKKKDNRFILYSTFSQQVRCRHADFKTLLITFNKPGLWLPAWCETCLQQEKRRVSN
jgi:hypothetical protein